MRSSRCPRASISRAARGQAPAMHRGLYALALAAAVAAAKTPSDTFVVAANMSQMITLDPAAINEGFTAGFIRKDNVDSVVKVEDSSTLTVTPTRPWTPSLFLFAFTDFRVAPILDRKEILKNEVNGDLGNKWLATHSACLGPFRVTAWRPQDMMT